MITLACACGGIGEYAIWSIIVAILGALGIKFSTDKVRFEITDISFDTNKTEDTHENHA